VPTSIGTDGTCSEIYTAIAGIERVPIEVGKRVLNDSAAHG
jgi:hypothetical protein